jgi:hypothetical protein
MAEIMWSPMLALKGNNSLEWAQKRTAVTYFDKLLRHLSYLGGNIKPLSRDKTNAAILNWMYPTCARGSELRSVTPVQGWPWSRAKQLVRRNEETFSQTDRHTCTHFLATDSLLSSSFLREIADWCLTFRDIVAVVFKAGTSVNMTRRIIREQWRPQLRNCAYSFLTYFKTRSFSSRGVSSCS